MKKILISLAAAILTIACNEEANSLQATQDSLPLDSLPLDSLTIDSLATDSLHIPATQPMNTVDSSTPGVYVMKFGKVSISPFSRDPSIECLADKLTLTLNFNDSTFTIIGSQTCNGETQEVRDTLSRVIPSSGYVDPGKTKYWTANIPGIGFRDLIIDDNFEMVEIEYKSWSAPQRLRTFYKE